MLRCHVLMRWFNPVVDPISGQPESKHTPVKVTPYHPVWHGFILSKSALTLVDTQYWIKIKGEQFWRYEVAGEVAIDDPLTWAQTLLGSDGEWLQFHDKAMQRFRAAKIKQGKLDSVLCIAPSHDLPARSWLGQLFLEQSLSDEARLSLLAGKAGAGLPDVGSMICACFGVGENTIKDAISCGDGKNGCRYR